MFLRYGILSKIASGMRIMLLSRIYTHMPYVRGIRVASVYPENEMTISGHHHIATYKYSNMTAFLENRLPLSIQW